MPQQIIVSLELHLRKYHTPIDFISHLHKPSSGSVQDVS